MNLHEHIDLRTINGWTHVEVFEDDCQQEWVVMTRPRGPMCPKSARMEKIVEFDDHIAVEMNIFIFDGLVVCEDNCPPLDTVKRLIQAYEEM
jgi:hypothetical protein